VVRGRPRTRTAHKGQVEAHSWVDFPAIGLAGSHLQDDSRAPRADCPPGPQTSDHLQDLPVAREKDRIDRKAHEKRVNRRRGPDQQPLAALQSTPSEQSPHPRKRRLGKAAPLANNATIDSPERNRLHHRFFAPSLKSPATVPADPKRLPNVIAWIATRRARRPAPPAGSANPRPASLSTQGGGSWGKRVSPTFVSPHGVNSRCECGRSGSRAGRRVRPIRAAR
jgi:hypothetical protein